MSIVFVHTQGLGLKMSFWKASAMLLIFAKLNEAIGSLGKTETSGLNEQGLYVTNMSM